jgi:hypothetical protein
MARMTEEEAWALDDLVTRTDITLGPNGSGWLSQRGARIAGVDDEEYNAPDEDAAAWLRGQAERAHTSVGQIITALVREKIAASQ